MKFLLILLLAVSTASYAKDNVTKIDLGLLHSYIDWKDWSMDTTEKALLVVHTIDILQTINHGKDPCYEEVDPVTRRLIGKHPSTEKVLAWGVGKMVFDHYAFKFVDNSNMPSWLKKTIKYTNLAIRADVVNNNYQIGIRIGGSNDHGKGNSNIQSCARRHGLMR